MIQWDDETWSPIVQNVTEIRTKCSLHFIKGNVGETYTFTYTGSSQEFVVPYDGVYKIELWGASSGNRGYGGFTAGEIKLMKNETFYFYIGGQSTKATGGYNGGGGTQNPYTVGGGGATDVRLIGGVWNSSIGLRSRIMVAGAGAGVNNNGIFAGGLVGYACSSNSYCNYQGRPGSQTIGGSAPLVYSENACTGTRGSAGGFGFGGTGGKDSPLDAKDRGGTGGGSGYYGGSGASGACSSDWSGGSGSSYISGHTGCVAIESENNQNPKSGCTTGTSEISCSYHYSGYQFMNTEMIDGSGYVWTNQKESQKVMPNPNGGFYDLGVGHTGNGFARIQFLG